jgi:SprT protein
MFKTLFNFSTANFSTAISALNPSTSASAPPSQSQRSQHSESLKITGHKVYTPLEQATLARVETDYVLAELFFKRCFPRPHIQFTLRGKSAGTAHLQLNKIRFNPVLLKENPEAYLNQVVCHEISHLLCFMLYGKVKPHGKEWQHMMQTVFKVPADTRHQLNTQSVVGKEFDYLCHCGQVKLSIRRHNRVVRGQTQYRCKRCLQMLKTA